MTTLHARHGVQDAHTPHASPPFWSRCKSPRWQILGVCVLVVAVAGGSAIPHRQSTLPLHPSGGGEFEVEQVIQGPFRHVIETSGQIDSANNAVVTNHVEWRTTILDVVPEGDRVEQGDILCELDSSDLRERAKARKIQLTRAEANFEQAKQNIKLQKDDNQRLISSAELAIELSQLDLAQFRDGEFEYRMSQLAGECALATDELSRSEDQYLYSKRLAMKGYRSQNDLEKARIAVTKSEVNLKVAQEKKKLLEAYTYKREIAELEAKARETKFELERVKLKCNLALLQAQISLKARERTYLIHKAYYDRLQRNIAACTIRAPKSGQVVYANQRRRRRSSNGIEEGAEVHNRQVLINLPDPSQLKVDVRIHESQIGLVQPGIPAQISIEAIENRTFTGTVQDISSVPVAGRWPNYDLREYQLSVAIDLPDDTRQVLKPGLTAKVDLIADERSSVVQVPIRSVVPVGQYHAAFVLTPLGPEQRMIKLGRANDTTIEVLDGLSPGESIVQSPRTQLADVIIDLESNPESVLAVEQKIADRSSSAPL